jgi:hypothetical protein
MDEHVSNHHFIYAFLNNSDDVSKDELLHLIECKSCLGRMIAAYPNKDWILKTALNRINDESRIG